MLSRPALAWGNEGHEIIALIAQAHLDPPVRSKVNALLAADTDPLTAHNIAAAATWADKLRDSRDAGVRQRTRQWHFVDIEIATPDLDQACFGHPSIPPGTPASRGPARDCVVDKIGQFAAELASPAIDPEERIVALKFLRHFVGDVHQPLHAADDHDRGGNDKRVTAVGFKAGNLHHYWDTAFVERLGPDATAIAADLNAHISAADIRGWSAGGPSDWAIESFRVARDDAYGRLPQPNARGTRRLPETYILVAKRDVAIELSKAGVRLALLLNQALASRA
jgi:hypothetical protein